MPKKFNFKIIKNYFNSAEKWKIKVLNFFEKSKIKVLNFSEKWNIKVLNFSEKWKIKVLNFFEKSKIKVLNFSEKWKIKVLNFFEKSKIKVLNFSEKWKIKVLNLSEKRKMKKYTNPFSNFKCFFLMFFSQIANISFKTWFIILKDFLFLHVFNIYLFILLFYIFLFLQFWLWQYLKNIVMIKNHNHKLISILSFFKSINKYNYNVFNSNTSDFYNIKSNSTFFKNKDLLYNLYKLNSTNKDTFINKIEFNNYINQFFFKCKNVKNFYLNLENNSINRNIRKKESLINLPTNKRPKRSVRFLFREFDEGINFGISNSYNEQKNFKKINTNYNIYNNISKYKNFIRSGKTLKIDAIKRHRFLFNKIIFFLNTHRSKIKLKKKRTKYSAWYRSRILHNKKFRNYYKKVSLRQTKKQRIEYPIISKFEPYRIRNIRNTNPKFPKDKNVVKKKKPRFYSILRGIGDHLDSKATNKQFTYPKIKQTQKYGNLVYTKKNRYPQMTPWPSLKYFVNKKRPALLKRIKFLNEYNNNKINNKKNEILELKKISEIKKRIKFYNKISHFIIPSHLKFFNNADLFDYQVYKKLSSRGHLYNAPGARKFVDGRKRFFCRTKRFLTLNLDPREFAHPLFYLWIKEAFTIETYRPFPVFYPYMRFYQNKGRRFKIPDFHYPRYKEAVSPFRLKFKYIPKTSQMEKQYMHEVQKNRFSDIRIQRRIMERYRSPWIRRNRNPWTRTMYHFFLFDRESFNSNYRLMRCEQAINNYITQSYLEFIHINKHKATKKKFWKKNKKENIEESKQLHYEYYYNYEQFNPWWWSDVPRKFGPKKFWQVKARDRRRRKRFDYTYHQLYAPQESVPLHNRFKNWHLYFDTDDYIKRRDNHYLKNDLLYYPTKGTYKFWNKKLYLGRHNTNKKKLNFYDLQNFNIKLIKKKRILNFYKDFIESQKRKKFYTKQRNNNKRIHNNKFKKIKYNPFILFFFNAIKLYDNDFGLWLLKKLNDLSKQKVSFFLFFYKIFLKYFNALFNDDKRTYFIYTILNFNYFLKYFNYLVIKQVVWYFTLNKKNFLILKMQYKLKVLFLKILYNFVIAVSSTFFFFWNYIINLYQDYILLHFSQIEEFISRFF